MVSRELARVARQFADQQSTRLADLPTVRPLIVSVTAVSGTTVTVTWRTETLTAAGILASYTPAAGDRVLCLLVDNQLIVIDRIV